MTSKKNANPYIGPSLSFDRKLLEIPLVESGEKMLELKKLVREAGIKVVFNHEPIILNDDKKIFYLRKSVAYGFIKAATKVNEAGYVIQVQDAYRNPSNQAAKFAKRVAEMKLVKGTIKGKKILEMANMYTAGIPILAAHTAGAAIDVILLDRNLKKIDMGSEYPEGRAESKTTHPELSKKVIALRKMLVSAMESSGLINYPFEWWHFSSGDVCATYLEKKPKAKYGPVYFEPKSGEMTFLPINQCYSYFAI